MRMSFFTIELGNHPNKAKRIKSVLYNDIKRRLPNCFIRENFIKRLCAHGSYIVFN